MIDPDAPPAQLLHEALQPPTDTAVAAATFQVRHLKPAQPFSKLAHPPSQTCCRLLFKELEEIKEELGR